MRRIQRDEDGAAMLIALGFIALFGLTIAAILGFADTSLRASDTVQTQRNNLYAADAAIEKTIADMRGDAAVGKFGSSCGQTVLDLNGLNVLVTCTPDPTSGTGGSAGGNGDAMVTTAVGSEYGIYRDANGDLAIGGNIRANSTVELGGGGTISTTGDLVAFGACDPDVTTLPTRIRDCGAGTVTDVLPYQPNAAVSAATGTRTACTAPLTIVKYKPGTYTSAAALSNVMRTSSLCSKSLFYFEPGTYHFNFTTGDDEWVIDDPNANIVGGKAVSALGVPATDPVIPAAKPLAGVPFPGACDATVAGVQFVFSGASRLKVNAGTVELCPVLGSGSVPPIAIYGSVNTSTTVTLTPTGSSGTTTFTNIPGAFTIGDGGNAKVALTRNQTGAVTLTGFDQHAIPAGAVIQTATMRVAHQEGNGGGRDNRDDLLANSGSVKLKGCTTTFGFNRETTMKTEVYTNAVTCLATPAAFTGIEATYSVSVPDQNNRVLDDYLDGIAIDVTYTNPGIAPATGCITATPFPHGGGDGDGDGDHCALLTTSGDKTNVALHGMLYAPKAPLDLSASSGSQQGYLQGIVARVVRLNITPSVAFPTTITTPGGVAVAPNDRLVELVATINGVTKLRARVRFDDQPSAGTAVSVERWSVVR